MSVCETVCLHLHQMFLAPPRQLSKTFQPTSGNLLAPPRSLKILQELKRLSWHKMRGLVVLVTLACFASAQHQALIDYLERRLLAIEVRLTLPPCRALRSRVPLRGNFQGQGKGNGMQMWANPEENAGKEQLSVMYRDYIHFRELHFMSVFLRHWHKM